MEIDGETGKIIMKKYLGNDSKLIKRLEHSVSVGDFSSQVSRRIAQTTPELDLDIDLCDFLGYCHDIGYSVADGKHEACTVELLLKEGIDIQVARKAMHGQLAEQFGEKEGNVAQYLPMGIEGIILTYCDMSVRVGEPVTIRERAQEIIERIKSIPTMPDTLKKDIEDNMNKALPRFERYEQVVLALAGIKSVREF